MGWTLENEPHEPRKRELRAAGWIQQRGRGGALAEWWSEPGTGKLYRETEAIQRARGKGNDAR